MFFFKKGVHADVHGIVGNTVYDPNYGRMNLQSGQTATDLKWWNASDPIWTAARRKVFFLSLQFL